MPKLARKGAYHQSQIWTTADLNEVQDYGVHRGIEVYVEVDMPGHTASNSHAYHDLITAYNKQHWGTYAQEALSGQLQLNFPDVRRFLTTLLRDLLPRVSLHYSYFHIGGDELNVEAYNLDPTVKSSSEAVSGVCSKRSLTT